MRKLNLPGTYWRGLAAQCAQKKALILCVFPNNNGRRKKVFQEKQFQLKIINSVGRSAFEISINTLLVFQSSLKFS